MDTTLPDVLSEYLSVIFCGINPGRDAAATGHHFHGRGNRFWKVLYLSGFTPELLRPKDSESLIAYGAGLTTAVNRATARANEIRPNELMASAGALEEKIQCYKPTYIAFLGKAAYLAITRQRDVHWGLQSATFGGSKVWVLPNPSGLNRSFSIDALVGAYRELRLAIGDTTDSTRTPEV